MDWEEIEDLEGSVLPVSRPFFDIKQVRTTRGLKRGNVLIEATTADMHYPKCRVLVLSEPYIEKAFSESTSWVDIIPLEGPAKGCIRSTSVADHSVISYGNVWNDVNYFLRTGRKRLTEEQIERKMKEVFKEDHRRL